MRTAIIMTYFERKAQLINTINSFHQYKGKDIVIVVVDDDSVKEPASELLLESGTFPATVINVTRKQWVNSSVPYNMGIEIALEYKPDIVLIQNAECYHAGDIIGHAEKNLTDKNYISYGCYSLPKGSEIPPLTMWPQGATFDGEGAWYNHPVYRAVGYHFCSAITPENLRKVNGFDERLAPGIAYEDNVFLHHIKNLGLKVEITDDPYVFHQWHYGEKNRDPELIRKNAKLWNYIRTTKEMMAVHKITPDL
jgi:GT2 family glycosyltransferase